MMIYIVFNELIHKNILLEELFEKVFDFIFLNFNYDFEIKDKGCNLKLALLISKTPLNDVQFSSFENQ